MNTKPYILMLLFVVGCCSIQAQQIENRQQTIASYDSVRITAPREKIYVHFDKTTYLPADTIWFKAYLVNATLHTPSTISSLIYTEIINDKGEIITRLSLPTAFGLTWGGLTLDREKYKPGNYTFRAYTNWMQNFGDTYFFKKEIKIFPLVESQATAENSAIARASGSNHNSRSESKKELDIDVQFLPESGSWVANRIQKIAFKALNSNGKGIQITGAISNAKQDKIIQFASNQLGMGYFTYIAEEGQSYTATVNYNGQSKTIQLPIAKTETTALKVVHNYLSDSITVAIHSPNAEVPYTLIGQSRGVICFVAPIKFNGTKTFKVAKSIFPTGVCQIILIDNTKKIINERNFFINHNDELNFSLTSASSSYGLRDSIPIKLKLSLNKTLPNTSSFSVSVTDDKQVAKNPVNDEDILSYFLLQSDLKGEIESPGYYFHQVDEQKHNDLDALMLTQGWVSYDWDLDKKTTFKAEKEYTLSGTVTNLFNKPGVDAKITLLGTNNGFMMLDTLTNDKGEFVFNNLPVMDSASLVIQALNAKGKKGTLGINMNEFKPPLSSFSSLKKPTSNLATIDSISATLIKTKVEEYKLTHRDGMLLNEVTIVGKKTIKGSKNINGPGGADLIITEEDLNKIAKKTLYDVLVEKVKGFRDGFPKKSTERMFFLSSNQLKLIIDGIELDFFYNEEDVSESTSSYISDNYYRYIKTYLDYYNAEDIRGIEVMNSAKYSWSYKNEFIKDPKDQNEYSFLEITTKTGGGPFLKKSANMYLLRPMNYGNNKVFYSPKYTGANKNDKKPDFRSTIYWNPNILTDEKGEGAFSFFSGDKKGTYTIWVEGMDMFGNFGFKTMKLTIN